MVISLPNGIKKPLRRRSGSKVSPNLNKSYDDAKESKSSVKVVIRVRPHNKREIENERNKSIIKVLDENILVFDPKDENNDFYFRNTKQCGRDMLKKPKKDLKLAFDRVFDGESTNEEIFHNTTRSVIDGLLNGYNSSVFAYGATGAGKTFTMVGTPDIPGITFLTVMGLYQRIEEIKAEKTCDIAVSYLEVYNEMIHDLLMPSKPLALREDPQRGVVISNLSLHKPKNAQDLLSMLQFGNRNRTQHPTDANAESSRSHAVFIVYVKQQDRTAGLQATVKVAKMLLIDLAGSERATVTSNSGARMREGANINKSLLALGNCINALADNRKMKGQHIPYRDSKLTRLLKDSLGGNCQTVMIAAVSPSSLSFEDTYNTLRYADRAKNIRAHLKKNVLNVDIHVTKYVKIVEELRGEIKELKEKLKEKEEAPPPTNELCPSCNNKLSEDDVIPTPIAPVIPRQINNVECDAQTRLQIQTLFQNRKSIQNELLHVEVADRQLELRLYWRKNNINRLAVLSKDSTMLEKSTTKVDNAAKLLKRKQIRFLGRKPAILEKLEENSGKLKEIRESILPNDQEMSCQDYKICETELDLIGCRKHIQHLQQMFRMQMSEIFRTETILEEALKLVKHQQLILTGHGYLSTDLVESFDLLQKKVEGFKEVAWADQKSADNPVNPELNVDKIIELPLSTVESRPSSVSSGYETTDSEPTAILTARSEEDSSKIEVPKATPKTCVNGIFNSVEVITDSRNVTSPKEVTSTILSNSSAKNMRERVQLSDSPVPPKSPILESIGRNTSSKVTKELYPSLSNVAANVHYNEPLLKPEVKKCLKFNEMSCSDDFNATFVVDPSPVRLNGKFHKPSIPSETFSANCELLRDEKSSSSILNKTFSKSATGNHGLNETFDASTKNVLSSNRFNYTKPNVSFADVLTKKPKENMPKLKLNDDFETLSMMPLSSFKSKKYSARLPTKKSDSRPLKRNNSFRHSKIDVKENDCRSGMKRFASMSSITTNMNKTAMLRNLYKSNNAECNDENKRPKFSRHMSASNVRRFIT